MTWNWKWKKMLLSISSDYSYFKLIFNYIGKGLWEGTLIFRNLATPVCFHSIMKLIHVLCKLGWIKLEKWKEKPCYYLMLGNDLYINDKRVQPH
jgi:hypothetical protein